MKSKLKIFIYFFSSFIILIYIYFITENKGSIKQNDAKYNTIVEDKKSENKIKNIFQNVEYKIKEKSNKYYTIKASEAFFFKSNSNLIYLKNVYSFTDLEDKTLLEITSNNAEYDKENQRIFYYNNFIMKNKERTINAHQAEYKPSKNTIKVEKNVVINDGTSIIKSDIVLASTITKDIVIKMFDKKQKVYGTTKK